MVGLALAHATFGQTVDKREGESEAAYQARSRAAARNRSLENNTPGIVKTPTENDATYHERLQRLIRNPKSDASIPLVNRQARESEDEYYDRLKKAILGLRALSLPASPLPAKRPIAVTKRPGESEAAYQARLRAAARNRTLSRSTNCPTIAFLDKTPEETYFAYEARLRTTVESLLALLSQPASAGDAR